MSKNAKYCGACGCRLKSTNRRTSPIGRKVTVCETCRRHQAKAIKAVA